MESLLHLPVQSGSGDPSYSINMYTLDAVSDSAEYILRTVDINSRKDFGAG